MKSNSLKVLLILASPGPELGGMENQVALQAKHLSEFTDINIGVTAEPCYQKQFSDPVKFFDSPMRKSRRHPLLTWQLIQIVRRFKPDIIHAHGHKAAYLTKVLRHLFTNTKFLATAHGTKRNNTAMQHLDQVFAVSKGVQSALSPIPSIIMENGIEPWHGPIISKPELCQSFNLDPTLPLVMATGRLVPVKRYDRLITAFNGLPANLIIWGDGPEYQRLNKITGSNTLLAGYRADVRATLNAADLLVITSEREGQSLSMIEALKSQVPVISTRVSGADDLLPESSLIESTDEPSLRAFLLKQLNRLDALTNEQQTLFNYANTTLTCERLARQTCEQYHSLQSS